MSERQKVEERIRRKQSEVLSLEEKLKAAKVYLSALRDIVKMFDADDEEIAPEGKLKAGSSVALTRGIILKRGFPMHADELLQDMGRSVTAANRSSLVGSLSAYVRKEEIFTRVAPNTFGLIELGHTEESATSDDDEPPPGFGQTPVVFSDDLDPDIPF